MNRRHMLGVTSAALIAPACAILPRVADAAPKPAIYISSERSDSVRLSGDEARTASGDGGKWTLLRIDGRGFTPGGAIAVQVRTADEVVIERAVVHGDDASRFSVQADNIELVRGGGLMIVQATDLTTGVASHVEAITARVW